MCGTTAASMILQGGGQTTRDVGTWKQANSEIEQIGFDAEVLDAEAGMTRQAADQVLQSGKLEEWRTRLEADAVIGEQRAGFGASGVDSGYGTAAELQVQSAKMGELDAQIIRQNAQNAATMMNFEASMKEEKARYLRGQKSDIKKARNLTILSENLTTAGQMVGGMSAGKKGK